MNWRTLIRAFLLFLAFAYLPCGVYSSTEEATSEAATGEAATGGGGAAEASPSEPLLTSEEIKKLPLKVLREKLADRGVECKACSEKEDYVSLFIESQSLPIKAKPTLNETSEPPRKKTAHEKMRENAQMADLMDRLKSQGFGNSQMFNAEDMKNMSPEEMAAKMGGNPFGGGARKPKASSSSPSSSTKKDSSSSSTKKKASSDTKSSTTKKAESAKTSKAKKETAKPKKEAKKPPPKKEKKSPVKKPTIRIEDDAFPKKVYSKKATQLEEEEGDYVEL